MSESAADNVAAADGGSSRSPTPETLRAASILSTITASSSATSYATTESQPNQTTQTTTTATSTNMSVQPVNPRPYLQARVGSEVVVRLKWGQTEYKGILQSIDSYMNVLLQDTVEFIDGQETGALGLVMIRCNNILWMGDASTVQMTTPASQ